MRLELLGAVRGWRDGRNLLLGPPKQRAVLGFLASRVNEAVDMEEIVDAVWGVDLPRTATRGVHTYVAGLRRALEPEGVAGPHRSVLVSTAGGYALRMDPAAVDARSFEARHAEARRRHVDGDTSEALGLLSSALELWRGGDAYEQIPGPFAAAERHRLHELRLAAVEEWADGMLALGRHVDVIPALRDLLLQEPLREKPRALLMLALHRSGRRSDALALYRETRQLLRGELGFDPGLELQALHQQILTSYPALFLPRPSPAGINARRRVGMAEAVPRPAQLPPTTRGFVGREDEMEQLESAVRTRSKEGPVPATLLIEGTPSVGKSALALKVAHRLADRFPDGQVFVDMCGANVQHAPLSLMRALGFVLASMGEDEESLPRGLPERLARYRQVLRGKRVVLVFDDVPMDTRIDVLVPAGPSVVLVTSRWRQTWLPARGVHQVTLEPLTTGESVRLLAMLVGRDRIGRELDAAEHLAQEGGHLPLALRMSADELLESPGISVHALLERIRKWSLDGFIIVGDALASIRLLLGASYQAQPAPVRRLFRLLGACECREVTVPAAAAIAGTSRDIAAALLRVLVDAHLMREVAPGRFRFYCLVGKYAWERAMDEPTESCLRARKRLAESETRQLRTARTQLTIPAPRPSGSAVRQGESNGGEDSVAAPPET